MGAQIISFNCILKNKAGKLISSTFNREVITSAEGQGAMLSGLVEGLQNLKKGEKRSISLSAEQAYGFYDPKKVILFPRKKISKEMSLRQGEAVTIVSKTGQHRSYRVVQVHGDMVTLDGNHPLAGQDLVFEIETLEARAATSEEIMESSNLMSGQYLH
ncbi:FKBP-type peptidyl-prolyl cis-trans isomerase SlyD [compost metagenome]